MCLCMSCVFIVISCPYMHCDVLFFVSVKVFTTYFLEPFTLQPFVEMFIMIKWVL